MNPPGVFQARTVISLLLIFVISVGTGCVPATKEAFVTPSGLSSIPTASETPSIPPTISPTWTSTLTHTPTPFVAKATIKIASQSPLSGDQGLVGTDIMRGAELAIKQLAEPLMEMGYKIELAPYDDQNDVGISVEAAKEIVADQQVLCTVGPYASRIVNQVKEIYHQAGLAFVSPSATAVFATASSYPEVNRVVGRHDGQGAAGAQFAKAQGFSRVFVISQNTDYARINAFHLRNESSRMGIDVVGNVETEATKDFGQLIDRAIAANAELIYFSTLSLEQAGMFFREARAAGYLGTLLGNEGIADPALLEFAGPLLIEGGGMYYTAIAAPANYYPESSKFIEEFETRYGSTPQTFAAQAYDAAGVCIKAIEKAVKGGEMPTRAEIANAIRSLRDYQGITGTYNFNTNGDPNPAHYFIFQVVSPDPRDWSLNRLITSVEISPPE